MADTNTNGNVVNPNEDITKIPFCTQLIAPEFDLVKPLPQGNFIPHRPGDDPPLERLVSVSSIILYDFIGIRRRVQTLYFLLHSANIVADNNPGSSDLPPLAKWSEITCPTPWR